MKKEKLYTKEEMQELIYETLKIEQKKHADILCYLLNKHSKPLSQGGMNYEKMLEEVEDFNSYLYDL